MKRLALLFIAVALATLVSTPARAAVPMCSDDGRSVVAPPIVYPWRMQTLDAPAPCPQPDSAFSQSLPGQEQRAPVSSPAPSAPRAVPVKPGELAAPESTRAITLAFAAPHGLELVDSLYRPPRA